MISSTKSKILIIDDEADIRALTAGILADEGFKTFSAANSSDALKQIKALTPDLILLDIWLQDSELDGGYTSEMCLDSSDEFDMK